MKKKSDPELIRLNKYISQSGLCSRRAADELIKKGKVQVNNKICDQVGTKINKNDKVIVNKKLIKPEKNIYVLLNKPKDYISTNKDTHNRRVVFDLIKGINKRLFSVGRLDRKTTGVLLLTNDGDIAKKLTHPSYKIKKIYSVTLEKKISNDEISQIKNGLFVEDEYIKVDDQNSFIMARRLIKEEGILSGGSSGTVLWAATQAAKNLGPNQKCLCILADGIRNYMGKFVLDQWMEENGFEI